MKDVKAPKERSGLKKVPYTFADSPKTQKASKVMAKNIKNAKSQ